MYTGRAWKVEIKRYVIRNAIASVYILHEMAASRCFLSEQQTQPGYCSRQYLQIHTSSDGTARGNVRARKIFYLRKEKLDFVVYPLRIVRVRSIPTHAQKDVKMERFLSPPRGFGAG